MEKDNMCYNENSNRIESPDKCSQKPQNASANTQNQNLKLNVDPSKENYKQTISSFYHSGYVLSETSNTSGNKNQGIQSNCQSALIPGTPCISGVYAVTERPNQMQNNELIHHNMPHMKTAAHPQDSVQKMPNVQQIQPNQQKSVFWRPSLAKNNKMHYNPQKPHDQMQKTPQHSAANFLNNAGNNGKHISNQNNTQLESNKYCYGGELQNDDRRHRSREKISNFRFTRIQFQNQNNRHVWDTQYSQQEKNMINVSGVCSGREEEGLSMPIYLQQKSQMRNCKNAKSVKNSNKNNTDELKTGQPITYSSAQTPLTCTPQSATTATTPMLDHADDGSSPGGSYENSPQYLPPRQSIQKLKQSLPIQEMKSVQQVDNEITNGNDCHQTGGMSESPAHKKVQALSSLRIIDSQKKKMSIHSANTTTNVGDMNRPIVHHKLSQQQQIQIQQHNSINLNLKQSQEDYNSVIIESGGNDENLQKRMLNDKVKGIVQQLHHPQENISMKIPKEISREVKNLINEVATKTNACEHINKSIKIERTGINRERYTNTPDATTHMNKENKFQTQTKWEEIIQKKSNENKSPRKTTRNAHIRISVCRHINEHEGHSENCYKNLSSGISKFKWDRKEETDIWQNLTILPLRAHLGSGAMGHVFLVRIGGENYALKIAVQSDAAACMYLRQGWANLVHLEMLYQQRKNKNSCRNNFRAENNFYDINSTESTMDNIDAGDSNKNEGYISMNKNNMHEQDDDIHINTKSNNECFGSDDENDLLSSYTCEHKLIGDCAGGGGDGRYFCRPIAYLEGDWMHFSGEDPGQCSYSVTRSQNNLSSYSQYISYPQFTRTPICGYLMSFVPYSCQLTVLIWHLHRSFECRDAIRQNTKYPVAKRMVSLALHVSAAHHQIACAADLYAFDFNPKNILVSVVLPNNHPLNLRKTLSSLEITNLVFLEKNISFRVTAIDLDCSLRPPFSIASDDPLLLDWDAGRRVVYSCPNVSSIVAAYILSVLAKNKSHGQFTKSGLSELSAHDAIVKRITDPTNFLHYIVDKGIGIKEQNQINDTNLYMQPSTNSQGLHISPIFDCFQGDGKIFESNNRRNMYTNSNYPGKTTVDKNVNDIYNSKKGLGQNNRNKKNSDEGGNMYVCSDYIIKEDEGSACEYAGPSHQSLFLYPINLPAREIPSKDHWRFGVRLLHHHSSLQLLAFVLCDIFDDRSLHNVILTYYKDYMQALNLPTDVGKIFCENTQIISCLCFSALTRMHSTSIPPPAFDTNVYTNILYSSNENKSQSKTVYKSSQQLNQFTHIRPHTNIFTHPHIAPTLTNLMSTVSKWPCGAMDNTPYPPSLCLQQIKGFNRYRSNNTREQYTSNALNACIIKKIGIAAISANSSEALFPRVYERKQNRDKMGENTKRWDRTFEDKSISKDIDHIQNFNIYANKSNDFPNISNERKIFQKNNPDCGNDRNINRPLHPRSELIRSAENCASINNNFETAYMHALKSLKNIGITIQDLSLWDRLELLPRVHPRQFLPSDNIFGDKYIDDIRQLNSLLIILLDPLPHKVQSFKTPHAAYACLIKQLEALLENLS